MVGAGRAFGGVALAAASSYALCALPAVAPVGRGLAGLLYAVPLLGLASAWALLSPDRRRR